MFQTAESSPGGPAIPHPDTILAELQAGHQRFLQDASRHPHCSRQRFLEVEEGQHPMAAILGCADSRVPVELLFDTGFGDLFVVRNAGTICTGAAIASLEYAVGHLGVALIVVLGHERCGAIETAFHPELRLTPNLSRVIGQLRLELFALGAAENLDQACRDHPRNAARNLVESSVLLTDRVREGRLRVEAAFYNLHTTTIDWYGAVKPRPLGE